MGNPILKIYTNGLLPLLLASLALPLSAQVSSENYVQTTQRISDTQVLATTQYYDGFGRPFEKVEQGVTPSGDNLIHLQQYDGLGREWKSWNPIYSSSAFLNLSDVSSLSQSQYSDSHAFSQNNYESSPLNRVIEVEGIGEDWKGHSVKSDHLINTSSFPLNCKYYRVSMSGELQDKGYYPEGRLYVTKSTDEDGHESYEFKNLAGHVILHRVMLGDTESADTYSGYNEGDRLNDWQGNYDESLSYDKMGNVQSLLRSGLLDDGSYGLIDNLSYSYHGNQLLKVDDAAIGPYYQGAFHFVDGADEAVEYEYDANGNMVRNLNKGISSVSYDLNNQPRKIEYNDGRNASYVYDAEGNKLSVSYNLTAMSTAQPQLPVMQSSDVASANVSNGQKTIDYCGNIIYDGEEAMILNDVGYALYNKDNNLSFHYYLKDHLGNNRVVVSEEGEIEQVNDYYPTGALMASSKGGDTQRFKYNGKELDRTNGLNWYDYGARNYDAEIVVWDGVDKLCEKYSPFTPYGYCKNNFVNAYDKDGNRIFFLKGSTQVFRDYFKQAIDYLKLHKVDGIFAKLQASKEIVYIGEQKKGESSVYKQNNRTILWDPLTCIETNNDVVISAVTVLNHEADHALQAIANPTQKSKDDVEKVETYETKEEERVIKGSEQRTALALGEIKGQEVTRTDHGGIPYSTSSPTSTTITRYELDEIYIKPKK